MITKPEPKFIRTVAVVSLLIDTSLCEDFTEIHQAAEAILGRQILNIMLGNREFMGKLSWHIINRWPGLQRELGRTIREDWREYALRIEGQFGEYLVVHEGTAT